MSRRHHKKSRNGCTDCKRRHIRCDEGRPACANCRKAELRCSFLSPDEAFIVPVTFDGPHLSPPDISRKRSNSNLISSPGSQAASSWAGESVVEHDEYSVNMTHMMLLNNFSSESYLSVERIGKGDIPTHLYYNNSFKTPYIMHQCLASSALHLAIHNPESATFYREYAAGLQHKALTLFNAAHPNLEVTPENCEATFLFSTLIGVQALSEAFVFQRDSIRAFMNAFTEGLKLYRGILAVVDQCYDELYENTETGSYLKQSSAFFRSTTSTDGPECEQLRQMLESTPMEPDGKQACRSATLELQHILNVQNLLPDTQVVCPVVLAWPIRISAEYMQLARDLNPQALVIFGHYAVLLHRARNLWVIGDGGEYLIREILKIVSPEWHQYMELPMRALQDNTPIAP